MWLWFALGSAVFAALTSILAKIGIEGVNSNLATAIRTVVVVMMAWGMVSARKAGSFLSCPALLQALPGCVTTKLCRSGKPQRSYRLTN